MHVRPPVRIGVVWNFPPVGTSLISMVFPASTCIVHVAPSVCFCIVVMPVCFGVVQVVFLAGMIAVFAVLPVCTCIMCAAPPIGFCIRVYDFDDGFGCFVEKMWMVVFVLSLWFS